MPEKVYVQFEGEQDLPNKRTKLAGGQELQDGPNQHPQQQHHIAKIPPTDSRRTGQRKAPSKIARSNRRALKFKENLQTSGERSTAELDGYQPKNSKEAENSTKNTSLPKRNSAFKSWAGTASATETDLNRGNLKARAAALQDVRKALPIWPYAEEIRRSLRHRGILLLVGETGSGKSTQVPQFLLSEPWCRRISIPASTPGNIATAKIGGCIAVTEPRRVAATTLARRVADEMGTPLGKASPASTVGYSVRFDENTSPSNKIKFVTEGMLLQEMLRDPNLTRYSAVVVDEVHERGVNVDLILGFLRRLVTRRHDGQVDGRGGVPLKIVIMSATAEGSELVKFFEDGFDQMEDSDIRTPVTEDAESEWSGITSDNGIESEHLTEHSDGVPQSTRNVGALYFRGRQHPVKILHTPHPVADVIEASLVRIFTINYQEPLPGDILVFLTGQKSVEALCALIEEYSATLSKTVPRLLAMPLFAALSQESQRRVFEPTPAPIKGHRGVRKVIVSTNIAETSVTVPGVRYVIDGGKEKVKEFRPRIGLDSLLTKPISHSSAIQRAGRAGREAPGRCYRLYTEPDFNALAARAFPEILRCDLAQAVLALMARGVPAHDVGTFPLLTMPPRESLRAALVQLHQLGAVDAEGYITKSGTLMARLPVSASMARALLRAAEPAMSCLDDMIDLVAAMSGEGIFMPGNEANEAEEDADLEQRNRRQDLWRRDGDHATMIVAVRGFAAENGDRRRWAEERELSFRAMRGIMDIRKQLTALKPQLLSLSGPEGSGPEACLPAEPSTAVSSSVLRCLIAGYPLNAAILTPEGSYRTIAGRQTVAIHPSSVLFRRGADATSGTLGKPAAIVYTEFVYTTRAYARGVSAVEVDWITEALGADWDAGQAA